jgi:hypothetical protein
VATSIVIGLSLSGLAQVTNPQISTSQTSGKPTAARTAGNLALGQKFVVDTVNMAVALPESDPQDRLRVLSTAAETVSPVDRALAKKLWQEGARIESELIGAGQKPVVSMMASGQADCLAAQNFVENLPPEAVLRAEQSLIGAISSCSKHTLDPASRNLDAALEKKVVAPRALVAAMEAQGTKSPWSQAHFEKMFSSLPDAQENANAGEAENFAAMYARMAPAVDPAAAAKAGLQLVDWLGKMSEQALQTDVVANTLVRSSAKEQKLDRAPAQGVSVLAAMAHNGSDQSDRLRNLPPAQRAREAAAHGFASATGGDKAQAAKYFDMAFSAADDAWEARSKETHAADAVREVGEAAAQINSTNALARAQQLRDSSAQAIAMLAVARVVASNGVVD